MSVSVRGWSEYDSVELWDSSLGSAFTQASVLQEAPLAVIDPLTFKHYHMFVRDDVRCLGLETWYDE